MVHVGGCQNYGPLLDPYQNTAPNIFRMPKKEGVVCLLHLPQLMVQNPVLELHFCMSSRHPNMS